MPPPRVVSFYFIAWTYIRALRTFTGTQHCCNMSNSRLGTYHWAVVALLLVVVVILKGACQDDGEAAAADQLQDAREPVSGR